jgi:hypothetical protein
MKNLLRQTDARWSEKPISTKYSDRTVGVSGCLVTTLTNIVNYRYNVFWTPLDLLSILQKCGGIDEEGLVHWLPAGKVLGFNYFANQRNSFSTKPDLFWVVQMPYKSTGHFCMLWQAVGDNISYHDPYTGQFEQAPIDRAISIRELQFYKEIL